MHPSERRTYPYGYVQPRLGTPDTDYEKEWWQNTTQAETNTSGERLRLNSPDTDTIFWAGMQWLDSQQQTAVNTVLPQNSPKLSHKNSRRMLSRVRQNMCIRFLWCFTRISFVCSAWIRVSSKVRNSAVPLDYLRSEISLSCTGNIPNLISHIYRIALIALEMRYWLCVYMVAQLHAHWNKHLRRVNFS